MATYEVIIPAAGQGKRMDAGQNKQFISLDDKPLIVHTVSVFMNDPCCNQIIIAANPSEISEMESLLHSWDITSNIMVTAGGAERQDSVYAGLQKVSEDSLVLIHDGARPFITQEEIHALVLKAEEHGAAVLGVKVKDTIKMVQDGVIQKTLDRSILWAIQTPQAFTYSLLTNAHEQAAIESFYGTDDASLVERVGGSVHIIEGSYDNIKLTTPEDLAAAETILLKRKEEM